MDNPAIASKALQKIVKNVSFYKRTSAKDLTIPGDAPKLFLMTEEGKKAPRYIAKTAKKHGTHEVLTEYLINCLGMSVRGLKISQSTIGIIKDLKTGPLLYFLSEFFHTREERLTHGIQLFEHFYSLKELEDIEAARKIRTVYTLENIHSAVELMYPDKIDVIFADFLKMCLFDAWIGNQDRHASNWGIIEPVTKSSRSPLRFSPIFDTARGLFWNRSEEWLRIVSNNGDIINYIEKSSPQIAVQANPKANHFQLMSAAIKNYPKYNRALRQLFSEIQKVNLDSILSRPLFQEGFSSLRRRAIKHCAKERLSRLSNIEGLGQ